jgi:hypothetical protein
LAEFHLVEASCSALDDELGTLELLGDLSSSFFAARRRSFAEICPFLMRSPIWRISSCTQALAPNGS